MRTFADSVPLKRWGEMSDVASLALYLASDESSYIHGSLIRIGGRRNPLPLLRLTLKLMSSRRGS